jgi:Phosphodiester glycosidase
VECTGRWRANIPHLARRRTHLRCAVALFILAPGLVRAEWKISATEDESSPNEFVEHWKTVVENETSGGRVILHSAVFDGRAATLRVIDQPDTPRSELAEVMARTGAIAGVNGGYFDPEDAPVGLLVSDGRVLSPLRKAKLLTGVLTASTSRVDVIRASRFAMSTKVKSAVQCGPLLVEHSVPTAGLNDTRTAPRTFAGVDGKGRTMLGVCSAVSLAQLGQILVLTNVAGKMKITRALNLDGGSSCAFGFAGKDGVFSIPEQKTVRDFVLIMPRGDR